MSHPIQLNEYKQQVLDIATGTGLVAIASAQIVGAEGQKDTLIF